MARASKKVQFCLATSASVTAAFFAGKYYERNSHPQKINITVHPTASIFGSLPNHSGTKSEISIPCFINKLHSLATKIIPKNLGSIKAASPLAEHALDKHQLQSSNVQRVSQIMKYGFPGLDNVISYSDYVLSYDRRNRVAHWVFEHLTQESVRKNDEVDRSKCNFMEDEHIHTFFRSSNTDYKGSGYDRGHLAAAGNHKACQKFVEETFYLSNMAPQVGKGFNRDSWNRLEKYVRKLTRVYPNVYCCTGPLYLPRKESNGKMYVKYEVIGSNHVAVPTHFFKVVVGESKDGTLEMECYVMENTVIDDSISLKSFQVPLELIERAAGLLFFDNAGKNRIYKINGKKT